MIARPSVWELWKRAWHTFFSFLLPRSIWLRLVRRRFRALESALKDETTDAFLELLLGALKVALVVIPGFRRNLGGWNGAVVFCTPDERVAASAVFEGGHMAISREAVESYKAKVVFKSGAALRAFLLSKDQDIFNSLLANDVAVKGNINYVYRFGFLAKDLLFRLRLFFQG